jgi:hypothetical protein
VYFVVCVLFVCAEKGKKGKRKSVKEPPPPPKQPPPPDANEENADNAEETTVDEALDNFGAVSEEEEEEEEEVPVEVEFDADGNPVEHLPSQGTGLFGTVFGTVLLNCAFEQCISKGGSFALAHACLHFLSFRLPLVLGTDLSLSVSLFCFCQVQSFISPSVVNPSKVCMPRPPSMPRSNHGCLCCKAPGTGTN